MRQTTQIDSENFIPFTEMEFQWTTLLDIVEFGRSDDLSRSIQQFAGLKTDFGVNSRT